MEGAKIWEEQVIIPTYEIGGRTKKSDFPGQAGVPGKLRQDLSVSTVEDQR